MRFRQQKIAAFRSDGRGCILGFIFFRPLVSLAEMKLRFVRILCAALLMTASALQADPLKWETKPGFRAAAVAPATPGKTGFTLLDATQTGIH